MAREIETPQEARQGEKKGWVRNVLIISTGLAVIAMIVAYLVVV